MDSSSKEQITEMMGSIGPECNELKRAYETCFNSWFSDKFLKGHKDIKACDPLLQSYTDCVKKALKSRNVDLVEMQKEYLGTPMEKQRPKT